MIILSQREPRNDDCEDEHILIDNQNEKQNNKIEIKKPINNSEILDDLKDNQVEKK